MPKSWQLISKIKQNSQAFFKIPEHEKQIHIYKLLVKISVITGWSLPEAELFDIFIEQFKLKMDEAYRFLNMDEIEYAFRTYKEEDYGKNFNLHIFTSVISRYLADRKQVDEYQDIQKEQVLIHNHVEQTDQELENELLEYSRKDYNGKKIYLLPPFLFDNLVKLNKIDLSENAKVKKYSEALKLHEALLRMDADTMEYDKIRAYQSFVKLRENNFDGIDKSLSLFIDSLHKKLYVREYFTQIKKESAGHV
jgi:hypothetical protein